MLSNRRFAPFALSLAAVLAVAASFSNPARASASYEAQPLRVMYLTSERIVTARLGKTETVRIEKPAEDDGREVTVYQKTALLVSTTLKGEHEPVVYVYHSSYGDYGNALTRIEEGQTFLAFLNPSGEGEGFQIDNMRSGLKILTDDELKIYTRRIEELDGIMQAKVPNVAELVEWLVRCIEEPATQWEGAYDLWISHNCAANEKQADAPIPPIPVTTEPEAIGEFQAITSTSSPSFGAAVSNFTINTDSNNEDQGIK
ncbi:MAG: hypothetical protein JOZ52_01845, partial [Acidobacteria bacterium]|nr:hypothetical protein [Acidobacteriota bacterium]